MIIVSGATGRLGSQVLRQLLNRVPAEMVGVSVRSESASRYTFEGADVAFIVSAPLLGQAAVDANCDTIDAAKAAGVGRIVYTSHQAAAHDSLFLPQPTHATTQDYLASLGIPFTALRNGFYASTIENFVRDALTTGRMTLPADGPVSWTAHADLAEAAAAVLLDETLLTGITPPLTAREAVDFGQIATMLTELTGRVIERVVIDDELWAAAAVERGVPEQASNIQLSMFRAARAGEFAITDPTLEKLIGHPVTSVRTLLEHLVAGDRQSV